MSNITSDSSDATREPLSVAALTVWTDDGPQAWSPDVLEPGTPELDAFRAALASGSAWLDLQLATDVQRWMRPWDPLRADEADWSPVATAASAVGLALPAGDGLRAANSFSAICM